MDKVVKLFEGQEVTIKTSEGNTIINLVHTAKCCGLVDTSKGTEKIIWIRVREKLKKINKDSDKVVADEITYILEEIENTDDRNSIYMSSWLSKRLALECHSDKAMRYKNFLVSMDEARESGQALMTAEQLAPHVYQLAQGTQILSQVVQGMQVAMTNMQEFVQDSIQSKDVQIEEISNLVGFRAVNTKRLSQRLKEYLEDKFGVTITANSALYIKYKNKIFKEFDVIKWEDIPVLKYNRVHAFIDEM